MSTDPRVDDYIDALPAWQGAICRRVRDLVHAADPEIEETIKRRVQPIAQIAADNRAGGWRTLKARGAAGNG